MFLCKFYIEQRNLIQAFFTDTSYNWMRKEQRTWNIHFNVINESVTRFMESVQESLHYVIDCNGIDVLEPLQGDVLNVHCSPWPEVPGYCNRYRFRFQIKVH